MNKRLRNTLLIIGTILILGGLIAATVLSNHVSMNPEGTVGNTAGNLNNRGLFCEYDGIVYFSNPYDNGNLYSMKPDETGFKKLGSASVELINAGGDYLYFFQTSSDASAGLGYIRTRNGIFRSDLNGKNTVSFCSGPAFSIQLADNYLYYLVTDDTNVYFKKHKIDKSEELVIANSQINPASVAGNKIYFNGTEDDHYLYALDINTNEISTVWEGNLWYPVVDGDYVYYMDVSNDYRLCRYSLSQDAVEVLTSDRVDTYNVCGNMIYYQTNSASNPCLMRMGLDGSYPEIVAEGIFSDINATSQYVYFHPFGSTTPTYRTPLNGPVQVSTFDAAMQAAMAHMTK